MGGCCHKQYFFLSKSHNRTSSAPLAFSPLHSFSEQKSKPSILVESDWPGEQNQANCGFYAQKVIATGGGKGKQGEDEEELSMEDEGTGVAFPIKFHDKPRKTGKCRVPRIRLPSHLSPVPESKPSPPSPTSPEVPLPDFSFNQRLPPDLPSGEISEDISEKSGDLRGDVSEEEDSSLATEGRQTLPPVVMSPGRPLLLRPLQIRTNFLEMPSEPASKLKRCSTQATALQGRRDSLHTLRGHFDYSLGAALHLADSLCTQVFAASSRDRQYTVYKYTKKKLKHMLMMRGRTALDVITQQIALMTATPPHPNVARLEEVIQTDLLIYIVLDCDYGESIASLAPLSEHSAASLFAKMLTAVGHIHREMQAGHFDLRPSSFFVGKDGEVAMSWLHPVLPLSALHGGEAKDVLALCAVLINVVTGQGGGEEEAYETTLEQLQSGELPSDLQVPAGLESFLSYCVSHQSELSVAVVQSHSWLSASHK